MDRRQRPPPEPQRQLPDPKEMKKRTLEQYAKTKEILIGSLSRAKLMLKDGDYGVYDATSVINLGLVLFQLEMGKEQGLAKVKQVEEMLKLSKQTPSK